MSAMRKGPFRDGKHTEQMLRDLYALHPDATCCVINAPDTTYPEDGREGVAMFGDRRRLAIPKAASQQAAPPAPQAEQREPLTDEQIDDILDRACVPEIAGVYPDYDREIARAIEAALVDAPKTETP